MTLRIAFRALAKNKMRASLTVLGVVIGIGASVGVTTVINSMTQSTEWPVVISYQAAAVAMLFAAAVGIFFGYYPALRASRLDPIDALRYE